MYENGTMKLEPKLASKRENFVSAARGCRKICEIGLNAGHSAYLLAHGSGQDLRDFLVFDLGEHAYVRPCFETLVGDFSARGIRFRAVLGDSLIKAPLWIQQNVSEMGTFDLVHVDGGHTLACITSDLAMAVLLTRPGGLIIVDDIQSEDIRGAINVWMSSGVLQLNMDFKYTELYPHVMLKKMC